MGIRGTKPQRKVSTKWSPELAYAVGLITTDGSLSKDGRHIDFTSQDVELAHLYRKCLGIQHIAIGYKKNSISGKRCSRIQFGDIHFYGWLEQIGLTQRKSLTLGPIAIPDKFFFDFVRGCFDGDGSIYSFWDTRWRDSFMFYIAFASGSRKFVEWLREKIRLSVGIKGHISASAGENTLQLRYAKRESLILFQRMFYEKNLPCLRRKFLKAQDIFAQQDKIVDRK